MLLKSFNILFLISVLWSCETSKGPTDKKTSDTYISNNIDTLARFIDLTSYKPRSASWTFKKLGVANERTPGPVDYNLQGLMTFDDTIIDRLKTTYKILSVEFHPRDIQHFKFNWLPQNYIFFKDSTLDVTYQSTFFKLSSYLDGGFIINGNDILLSFSTQ